MTAAAGTRSLLRLRGLEPAAMALIWLTMATSGLVMNEPAPFDALMMVLVVAGLVLGIKVNAGIAPLALLLAVHFLAEVVGTSQADATDAAFRFTMITLYLSTSALFFACLIAWNPARVLPVLISGMMMAALIASLAAIAGYFDLFAGASEAFTRFERAKGTFKDPNVFAPFLILPILYAVSKILTARRGIPLLCPLLVIPMLLALLLSFSRGGWAHFAISSFLLVVFYALFVPSRAVRARTALLVFAGGFVLVLGVIGTLSVESVGSLFTERANFSQSHDHGPEGRFAGQTKAIGVIVGEPLGIGTFAFERYHHEQPHNVYLNVFLNAGWIGGFTFLAMMLMTAWRALTIAVRVGPYQMLAIPVSATFLGLMLEGLIVDIDHWRHLFLLIGAVWGVSVAVGRTGSRPA